MQGPDGSISHQFKQVLPLHKYLIKYTVKCKEVTASTDTGTIKEVNDLIDRAITRRDEVRVRSLQGGDASSSKKESRNRYIDSENQLDIAVFD